MPSDTDDWSTVFARSTIGSEAVVYRSTFILCVSFKDQLPPRGKRMLPAVTECLHKICASTHKTSILSCDPEYLCYYKGMPEDGGKGSNCPAAPEKVR
jgi:hypothetical protein